MALTETYQLCCRKPWHNEPAQWYGSMFKVISKRIWGCCNWHCHVSSKVGTSHEEAFSQEGCLFEWLWSHLDRFKNLKTTFEAWKRRFILGHVNVLEIPIFTSGNGGFYDAALETDRDHRWGCRWTCCQKAMSHRCDSVLSTWTLLHWNSCHPSRLSETGALFYECVFGFHVGGVVSVLQLWET